MLMITICIFAPLLNTGDLIISTILFLYSLIYFFFIVSNFRISSLSSNGFLIFALNRFNAD